MFPQPATSSESPPTSTSSLNLFFSQCRAKKASPRSQAPLFALTGPPVTTQCVASSSKPTTLSSRTRLNALHSSPTQLKQTSTLFDAAPGPGPSGTVSLPNPKQTPVLPAASNAVPLVPSSPKLNATKRLDTSTRPEPSKKPRTYSVSSFDSNYNNINYVP